MAFLYTIYKGKRYKITFHSFRRFVKTTISNLGHADFSEYYIGHAGSTYYRATEEEKLKIFRKIEPYLTYLDYSELEAKGADTKTELDQLKSQMVDMQATLKELYQQGLLKKG